MKPPQSHLLLFLLCSSLYLAPVGGQSDQIRFDHITSKQGLSENVVNCILQDSRGFIWLGTHDGLNRYDGYQIRTFKPSPEEDHSINSNLVFALTEDGLGRIWIGTTGSGLNIYDPVSEKFTAYLHDPDNPNSLCNDQVIALFTDYQGRIWIGTFQGVNLVIPGAKREEPPIFKSLDIESRGLPVTANCFVQDISGNVWVGTRSGLFRAASSQSSGDLKIENVPFSTPNLPESVKCLALDERGNLILGTATGIYYQSRKGPLPQFEKISDLKNQNAILVENQQRFWVGGDQGLLSFTSAGGPPYWKQHKTYVSEPENYYSLNTNVVRCIMKDRNGIIWLGTDGGGSNKFDPSRKPFYQYGSKLSNNGYRYKKIRSIFEDSQGRVWVGTEGGGLFHQSCPNSQCGDFENLQNIGQAKSVFALAEVTEGKNRFIYAGSQDPPFLQKFSLTEPGSDSPTIQPALIGRGSVFSILQDRKQAIWIGRYNHGLIRRIRKEDGSFEESEFKKQKGKDRWLSNNIIRKIYEDSRGNLWIGTADGLNVIPADQTLLEAPEFVVFKNSKTDTNTISHNYILDIQEGKTGTLWIGTFGGGLNRMTVGETLASATFKRYTETSGLPNNSVKCVQLDDHGKLWIAGNNGLSRFDPERETFHNFGPGDGLQNAEFLEGASFKLSHGDLMFGGVNGFNLFDPLEIRENQEPPVVRFTRLLVHNREVKPGQKVGKTNILSKSISCSKNLTLNYNQNDFSIEFAALHFAAPEKNRYAYKLNGYHHDWIHVGADKRYATFTNLPHGKYTLLVKGSNGDGAWNSQPESLSIRIKPPFWFTWYAYLAYALFLLTAVWLLGRYTVISIREKHQLTLEYLQREKIEELNQMKLRFFTNISHEFRTPLTLIIGPLEYILKQRRELSTEKLQLQHHYMYKNAKYLLRLVDQLLNFRKLDEGNLHLKVGKGDIVNFIRETTEPFRFLANKKDIHFQVESGDRNIYALFDPDVVEKAIYNLLSNAFKFTPAGGRIGVVIAEREMVVKERSAPFVEIRVQDNGPGVSRKKIDKIFERFYKESSKKENKDGAGIGLAYTKSLVELHHGNITVESKPGKGAIFIVRLPLDKKAYLKSETDQVFLDEFEPNSDPLEYLVSEPANAALIDDKPEDPEGNLPLLLFVDDNSDIRQFIREGFQNDFRIIEAADGQQGYDIAIASLPDMVVSDIIMPNLDGTSLCKALKDNPLTSHIPVVLLTAKSTSEDELAGFEKGADAYIAKPFKLEILRAKLKNIYLFREKLRQNFKKEMILQPKDITVTSADEDFLKKAVGCVELHLSEASFNVEELVREMHISRSKLYLKIKALTGLSTSEFIRNIRLKRAIQLLEKSDYTIKEIMYMTGFNTASYFSKCFKKQYGVVPSEYLKQQETKSGKPFVI